jgi:MoxR-like ATPase
VVRRVAQVLGGRYFEYLLGRFTEPSELFGPVDLRKLREGSVETDVTGMLPEADVAFLNEVFLGSTAILNTLLGMLNERRFRRGHTQLACPLRVCVGASNALPDDEALAAFGDRFLLHAFIEPLPDHQLEALLSGGWQSEQLPVQPTGGLAHLDALCQLLPEVRAVAGARPARPGAGTERLPRGGAGGGRRRAVDLPPATAASGIARRAVRGYGFLAVAAPEPAARHGDAGHAHGRTACAADVVAHGPFARGCPHAPGTGP